MADARAHDVSLRRWGERDLPVLERSNTPEMTEFLGGPESPEKLVARQAKFLRLWADGEARMFAIVVDGVDVPVGSVGYWQAQWRGEPVYESGWSVATGFQGRGFASRALRLCIADAVATGDRDTLVAFPRVDNVASNALCHAGGLTLVGEEDFEYPKGTPIRVNAWVADLAALRRL